MQLGRHKLTTTAKCPAYALVGHRELNVRYSACVCLWSDVCSAASVVLRASCLAPTRMLMKHKEGSVRRWFLSTYDPVNTVTLSQLQYRRCASHWAAVQDYKTVWILHANDVIPVCVLEASPLCIVTVWNERQPLEKCDRKILSHVCSTCPSGKGPSTGIHPLCTTEITIVHNSSKMLESVNLIMLFLC